MANRSFPFLALVYLIGTASFRTSEASTQPWVDLLKKAQLTSEQVRPDSTLREQFGQARYRTPFQELLIQEPLRIPAMARLFREQVLLTQGAPHLMLIQALSKIELAPRRGLAGNPIASIEKISAQPGALLQAIVEIHESKKKPLTRAERTTLEKKIGALPPELAKIAALLLVVERQTSQTRDHVFKPLMNGTKLRDAFQEKTRRLKREGEDDLSPASPLISTVLPSVDFKEFWVAGVDLLLAIQSARAQIASLSANLKASFHHQTPLGDIVIRGADSDDSYESKPYLLILDLGGNDTYFSGGSTQSELNPVSILIDRSGNDRYIASKSLAEKSPLDHEERKLPQIPPSWGSGVFGYGILVDESGDDLYRGFRLSGGTAEFGMGVLVDRSGLDRYECHERCQGYASVGVGLLIDQAGADHYVALQSAQGVGGIRGSGVLLDLGNQDDHYLTRHPILDFPSPIDPQSNVSLSQGAAVGYRADFIDQNSFSGGMGALFDEGGNNEFTAGFFAQGVAYWYGVGLLSVGQGNDQFRATKYAGGAGVHFGVGVLHDVGGNDQYQVAQELGLGEGHDFGIGVLVDEAGNDQYVCDNLALGSASAQGIGLFWDRSGDDLYQSTGKLVLGGVASRTSSPSFRDRAKTIGLFLDSGGKNRFETPLQEPNRVQKSGSWRNVAEQSSKVTRFFHGAGLVTQSPETEEPDLIGEQDE